jgi:hypothetical protein
MFGPDLADARESLAYWEDRSRRLPRYAVRRRHEARMMSARWRARVAEAERAAYGAGWLGTLLLLVVERRLPVTVHDGARRVARRGAQAAVVLAATCVALVVLAIAAVLQLLLAVF